MGISFSSQNAGLILLPSGIDSVTLMSHLHTKPKGTSVGSSQKKLEKADLQDPIAIADFLTQAFETNDLQLVLKSLWTIIMKQNVLALAEVSGLRREGLYRTFNANNDPRIGRIMKLLAAMDVQLIVKALPPSPKPPRPKRGPPFRNKPVVSK
jgi:probable addiction module antidote protein